MRDSYFKFPDNFDFQTTIQGITGELGEPDTIGFPSNGFEILKYGYREITLYKGFLSKITDYFWREDAEDITTDEFYKYIQDRGWSWRDNDRYNIDDADCIIVNERFQVVFSDHKLYSITNQFDNEQDY